jgi:hypothetical protein
MRRRGDNRHLEKARIGHRLSRPGIVKPGGGQGRPPPRMGAPGPGNPQDGVHRPLLLRLEPLHRRASRRPQSRGPALRSGRRVLQGSGRPRLLPRPHPHPRQQGGYPLHRLTRGEPCPGALHSRARAGPPPPRSRHSRHAHGHPRTSRPAPDRRFLSRGPVLLHLRRRHGHAGQRHLPPGHDCLRKEVPPPRRQPPTAHHLHQPRFGEPFRSSHSLQPGKPGPRSHGRAGGFPT